jgi:hypothetical protein
MMVNQLASGEEIVSKRPYVEFWQKGLDPETQAFNTLARQIVRATFLPRPPSFPAPIFNSIR